MSDFKKKFRRLQKLKKEDLPVVWVNYKNRNNEVVFESSYKVLI